MTDVQDRLQDWGILGPPLLAGGTYDQLYFHDLNLDQVVAAVAATRAEYGIQTFFKLQGPAPGAGFGAMPPGRFPRPRPSRNPPGHRVVLFRDAAHA